MTKTPISTVTYWVLAVIFALVFVWAVVGLVVNFEAMHWRYALWWLAIAGTHLYRSPLVIVIWVAFLFDLFEPMMWFLYASQAVAVPFLLAPILILGLLIYLWRRDQFKRFTPIPTS
ncbi:hypothetical protein N9O61_06700 [Octadecabacter sp.]|nr:hypothetical protein [Octadecabacter sp.]